MSGDYSYPSVINHIGISTLIWNNAKKDEDKEGVDGEGNALTAEHRQNRRKENVNEFLNQMSEEQTL